MRQKPPGAPRGGATGLDKLVCAQSSPLMTTIRSETIRQSDRITLRMPLEASWVDGNGMVRRLSAQTLLVSRNGGVVRLQDAFPAGQELMLRRVLEGDKIKTVRARIVAEIDREPEGFLYAIHLLEPRADFWDIE